MVEQYLRRLFGLSDQVALVTGGGGVLGGLVSKALAAAGAHVVVVDLDPQRAHSVVSDISMDGGHATALAIDVQERSTLEKALIEITDRLGPVDILVNSVGGNRQEAVTAPDRFFFDIPQEAFLSVLELNLQSILVPCQVVGRHMARQGDGVILNVSSIAGFRPLTDNPAYCAAKAAVNSFTRWLAVHMSHNYSRRIRVNALAPGFFVTDENRHILTHESSGETTKRGNAVLRQTPMARFGVPEDMIGTVLWIVSPSAAYVHGSVVTVDGGFSAFGGV